LFSSLFDSTRSLFLLPPLPLPFEVEVCGCDEIKADDEDEDDGDDEDEGAKSRGFCPDSESRSLTSWWPVVALSLLGLFLRFLIG